MRKRLISSDFSQTSSLRFVCFSPDALYPAGIGCPKLANRLEAKRHMGFTRKTDKLDA
jgi:hypothetical protein